MLAKHLASEVLREAVLTLVHCAEGSGAAQVPDSQTICKFSVCCVPYELSMLF